MTADWVARKFVLSTLIFKLFSDNAMNVSSQQYQVNIAPTYNNNQQNSTSSQVWSQGVPQTNETDEMKTIVLQNNVQQEIPNTDKTIRFDHSQQEEIFELKDEKLRGGFHILQVYEINPWSYSRWIQYFQKGGVQPSVTQNDKKLVVPDQQEFCTYKLLVRSFFGILHTQEYVVANRFDYSYEYGETKYSDFHTSQQNKQYVPNKTYAMAVETNQTNEGSFLFDISDVRLRCSQGWYSTLNNPTPILVLDNLEEGKGQTTYRNYTTYDNKKYHPYQGYIYALVIVLVFFKCFIIIYSYLILRYRNQQMNMNLQKGNPDDWGFQPLPGYQEIDLKNKIYKTISNVSSSIGSKIKSHKMEEIEMSVDLSNRSKVIKTSSDVSSSLLSDLEGQQYQTLIIQDSPSSFKNDKAYFKS